MTTTQQGALFIGLPAERDIVATFIVDGEPVSKARARFTNYRSPGRMYTPEKTLTAEKRMGYEFRRAGGVLNPDAEVTFGVSATFYNGTHQRRDVDNMLKLVLDGLNKVAWVDDNQVVEAGGRKRYTGDKSSAHTEVVIYRVGRIERNTRQCVVCGKEFLVYDSWSKKKNCSAECMSAARRKARERTCEHCGAPFLTHGDASGRRFCSKDCGNESRRLMVMCDHCGDTFSRQQGHVRSMNYCSDRCRDAAAAPRRIVGSLGTCADCGGPTSKKIYVRCRACSFKTDVRRIDRGEART